VVCIPNKIEEQSPGTRFVPAETALQLESKIGPYGLPRQSKTQPLRISSARGKCHGPRCINQRYVARGKLRGPIDLGHGRLAGHLE
jgi:hypothetical protein